MPAISRLPAALENVSALLTREAKAYSKLQRWMPLYQEAMRYAMPTRDTFSEWSPGTEKAQRLYDSTLQECTYEAANTMVANLFPPWMVWASLIPGGAFSGVEIPQKILVGLHKATRKFYQFINHSNFSSVIHECALDLLVGTCALYFDEGVENDKPFNFQSMPLSIVEIEEGPNGTIETTWLRRKPKVENLQRMYVGMQTYDWPQELLRLLTDKPDAEVEIIQGEIYNAEDGHYYGVVIETKSKSIIWRFDYDQSCPSIIARATKVAGEVYGRGRILLALADARTLDKMVEFVLRQAALQIAPPMTGVSDGVLNPYNASPQPNIVIPVASNDTGNPSLRVLEVGGDFNITNEMLTQLRERVRRTMMGPEYSTGPIKTATEIMKADRDRLWAMNGEYSRIQAELLAKIVARGVYILQKRGEIPKFRIDGKEVSISYSSPFAKSQANEDLMSLQTVFELCNLIPGAAMVVPTRLNTEKMPGWIAERASLDPDLVRTEDEAKEAAKELAAGMAQATQAGVEIPQVA